MLYQLNFNSILFGPVGDRFNIMDAVQFFPDEPQAFRNLFLFHVLNLDRFHLVILLRMTQFKCFTEELSLDLELTVNRWRNLPHIPLFLSSLVYYEHPRCPFAHLYLWRALSALAETKLVKDYKYMIQDLCMRSRQTISGEVFKDKSRVYYLKGHLGTLRQKVTSTSS